MVQSCGLLPICHGSAAGTFPGAHTPQSWWCYMAAKWSFLLPRLFFRHAWQHT